MKDELDAAADGRGSDQVAFALAARWHDNQRLDTRGSPKAGGGCWVVIIVW